MNQKNNQELDEDNKAQDYFLKAVEKPQGKFDL